MSDGTVYLLHFAAPIGDLDNPHGAAQHQWSGAPYLGARLGAHRDGVGAAIMKAVAEAGIDFTVARTWEGNRRLERSLKNRHDHPGLCPVCRGQEPHLDPRTKIVDVGEGIERWVERRRAELAAEDHAARAQIPDAADRQERTAATSEVAVTTAGTDRERELAQADWPVPAPTWRATPELEQARGWER